MDKIIKFLDKMGRELERKAVPKKIEALPPEEIHFELTYKCNSKCIMCNLRHLGKKEKELSLKSIKEIVMKSDLLKNIKSVVLSGGEPLLREDFPDIFKFITKAFPGKNIHVLSNFINTGLILKKLAVITPLIDMKLLSLGSSLDGLNLSHDKIRGVKGAFSKLIKTIDAIRKKYPQLYFSLNFTITPKNCGQILKVYEWCKKNGHHISFQLMVQKKETRQFLWKPEHVSIIESQINSIIEDVYKNSKINGPTALLLNKGLLSYLLSLRYIPKYMKEKRRFFPNCPCGQKFAMLDPYGNLYFCPVHKDKVAGNIRKSGFDNVWLSGRSKGIRSFFDEKKCHCWLTCTNGYMLEDAFNDN